RRTSPATRASTAPGACSACNPCSPCTPVTLVTPVGAAIAAITVMAVPDTYRGYSRSYRGCGRQPGGLEPQRCSGGATVARQRHHDGTSPQEEAAMSTSQFDSARVVRKLRGRAASDGAGVKLTRVIGGPELPDFDPFLLLDEFGTDRAEDYIAGFPDHPHRGFETVTYMLDGRMRHRDNHGNEGLLVPGSVQWMTAGRGLVHSEMPEQEEGRMRGFQLWVNLPAKEKMTEPRYQEFAPESIPL